MPHFKRGFFSHFIRCNFCHKYSGLIKKNLKNVTLIKNKNLVLEIGFFEIVLYK